MKSLQRKPQSAKEAAAALAAARQEYQQIVSAQNGSAYMGEMARESKAELANFTAQWRDVIVNDTLQDFNKRLEGYTKAAQAADVAQANSGSQWQADKMLNERRFAESSLQLAMRGAAARIDGSQAAVLEAELKRATLQQEPHRKKAMLESLLSVELDESAKRTAGGIQAQAREHLARLERTPEVEQAFQRQQQEADNIRLGYSDLRQAANSLGESVGGMFDTGALAQAARRVQFAQDGSVIVHEPDSPEVTGVSLR